MLQGSLKDQSKIMCHLKWKLGAYFHDKNLINYYSQMYNKVRSKLYPARQIEEPKRNWKKYRYVIWIYLQESYIFFRKILFLIIIYYTATDIEFYF